jgi:hypothetical protein
MAADSWDRLVLAEHRAAQVGLELLQRLGVGLGDRLRRDAGDLGDHRLDLLEADGLLALASAAASGGAGLVDDVDRLVRQLAVGDVLGRQLHRRLERLGGVLQLVKFLVVGLQALEDLSSCPRSSAR